MELVDLYDENRVPLGRVAERHAKKAPGEYRMVVHGWIVNGLGQMLIQQRSPEKTIWPELWDVSIGGGVDAGETSRQGAVREVGEELGYDLDLIGLRPAVTVNFEGGFDDFFVVTRDLDLGDLRLQKEEVSDVRWATLEETLAMVGMMFLTMGMTQMLAENHLMIVAEMTPVKMILVMTVGITIHLPCLLMRLNSLKMSCSKILLQNK